MRQSYFTFLYNECKRSSKHHVDISEIKDFINTPAGQQGYRSFCAMRGFSNEKKSIQSVADALTGLCHE